MRVLGTMRAVLSHHVDIINKCQMLLAVKGNGQRERGSSGLFGPSWGSSRA